MSLSDLKSGVIKSKIIQYFSCIICTFHNRHTYYSMYICMYTNMYFVGDSSDFEVKVCLSIILYLHTVFGM